MRINQVVQNQNTYQFNSKVVKTQENTRPNDQSSPVSDIKFSQQGIKLAEQFQQDKRSVIYDQPSFNASKAVQSYSAVQNENRRSEIQALIGVDLYA
ncbi:hypothetical protein [Pseudoalteromonas luteoviolacea]|uniref:Uncharacterized protein n=1 Tax=Pseudoalteromonas luteoviolacea S4054 TaxID=1129367 RepID=A0A0F6ABW1_9GAMM|nr:hypothetical protein [Pseudoalteromonas luteoviolacea]AOT10616.1 hypothetical protein S4054249_22400 [Pseudoalteromonas luteoviolacea]AOT15316.1 hypothetical protein S40542_21195 [Pseudoalteromonas luteoviolacea]AOT20435.1 hypothetical protein S4054_22315 [Pseudoalteromonas luteoviolacea]KKE83712.1 hypothetical protein N479_12865 [Pseudoalteromonas luteoviolacea S4054]KZN71916.1 hypothetical protein N481_17230 [Pseudoalteromonas luteoviolacea S4047-1]